MGMVLESLDEPGVRHRISRVTTTLGRGGGNDIAINSTSVSRNHSRIVIASDGACLIDLESTNGCSINDQRVTRQFINDGDVVAIGKVKFKFATGVPPEIDDRSMDETHTLLEDSEIFTPVPKSKALSAHEHAAKAKQK
jgi:S-DNA-T family DNA segregation ATPase FtsK/SpoIIIE